MEKKSNQGRKYFSRGRGWYNYRNRNFGQRFGKGEKPAGLLKDQESIEDGSSDSEDFTETTNCGPYSGWGLYFSDEGLFLWLMLKYENKVLKLISIFQCTVPPQLQSIRCNQLRSTSQGTRAYSI